MAPESSSNSQLGCSRREQEVREIEDALRGLQYGSVNVVVQDGIVVQIDRLEKRRLHRPAKDSAQ